MKNKMKDNTTDLGAKSKKGQNLAISLKLIISSLFVMIVLSAAITAVYVFPFRAIAQSTTEQYLLEASGQIAHKINLVFEKSLNETQVYANMLAMIYRNTDRERMIDILVDWYRNSPQYMAVFTNFGPGQFDNRDRVFLNDSRFAHGAFATYISRIAEDDNRIRITADVRNYWTQDRFRIPYETQRSYISKPMYQQVSQESEEYFLLMRISSPIIHNGQSVGVVGVDYSMEDIVRLISRYMVLNSDRGFASLALGDGSIIASKDASLIHRNIFDLLSSNFVGGNEQRRQLADILGSRKGNMILATEFQPGERTITGLYKFSIGNTDSSFIVMASIPEDEIFSAIDESTENAILTSLVVFVAGIIFLFILIRLVVITPIMEQMRIIEKLSITDPLTGLSNRRNFENTLNREWKVAVRNKKPIAFLMLDADKFKTYNDTYGHPQGDKLLIAISNVLKRAVHRPSDLPGRLGGEEFGILLPNTDLQGAVHIAENIRVEIERLRVKVVETGKITTTTVSIGAAAMIPGVNDTHEVIMKIADDHLYKAKETGRNRVHSDLNKS